MSENKEVLVDWDKTLFDTPEFCKDLWQDLADFSGRNVNQVTVDGSRFHVDPVLGGYEFEAHMAEYGMSLEESWARLGRLILSKNYLYEDSVPFIQDLLADGYNPSILSFGESKFQTAKILPYIDLLVGELAPSLGVDIVSCPKGLYIAQNYPGVKGMLVDDVPDQKLPPNFTEVHIDRSSGLTEPQQKVGGYTVADLEQALQVINAGSFPLLKT